MGVETVGLLELMPDIDHGRRSGFAAIPESQELELVPSIDRENGSGELDVGSGYHLGEYPPQLGVDLALELLIPAQIQAGHLLESELVAVH